MILGIGSDLIDIRRIEETLNRHGERFTKRCFTAVERDISDSRRERAASYAKRFAAKEATAKALGTGVADGVALKDMGVVNLPEGRPIMELTGGAAQKAAEMTPPGHRLDIHLSITDEYPLAQAFVILYAAPVT